MSTEKIYRYLKEHTEGLDAIYQDRIIQLVGLIGLETLKEERLIEGCGSINGRPLYVLCDESCLSR